MKDKKLVKESLNEYMVDYNPKVTSATDNIFGDDKEYKEPEEVEIGDIVIDYNGEEGVIEDIMLYDGSKQQLDILGKYNEILDYVEEGEWVVLVTGNFNNSPEHGYNQGVGSQWFVYGDSGVEVPRSITSWRKKHN